MRRATPMQRAAESSEDSIPMNYLVGRYCKNANPKARRLLEAICVGIGIGASVSSAAESPPKALVEMCAAFATAVAAKNTNAAAALTRFPLKNDVYGGPKSISRAAFSAEVVLA